MSSASDEKRGAGSMDAAAGAAVWAVAPRTFNDKRRNFVPSIPEVAVASIVACMMRVLVWSAIPISLIMVGIIRLAPKPIPLSDPSPKTMIMCRLPVAWLSRPATAVRI